MPSRRRTLASAALACSGGVLGGCLSPFGTRKDGHLQLKGVSVTWEYRGRTYRDQPLLLRFEVDDRTVYGRHDPRYVGDSVRAPDEVVVPDGVHDALSERFEVTYVLGVCGEDFAERSGAYGCLNAETGLDDFNRVQLNDQARVERNGDRLDVVGVSRDAYGVAGAEVRPFDFRALHRDDGLPDVEV